MTAHDECRGAGKFDCTADEVIYDMTMDDGAGEGNVEASSGWWLAVDLVGPTSGGQADALAEHYGARYLIAREDSQGRFWVEAYATPYFRGQREEELEKAYRAWYSDAELGEEESWDAR